MKETRGEIIPRSERRINMVLKRSSPRISVPKKSRDWREKEKSCSVTKPAGLP